MQHDKIVANIRQLEKILIQLESSDYNGNIRKEVAKRLDISVQEADRYRAFLKLIPELQNLFFDKKTGMSNLLKLKPYSSYKQRDFHDILVNAFEDNYKLSRPFINHLISNYQLGNTNWEKIKIHCKNFKKTSRTKTSWTSFSERQFNYYDTFQLTGIEFEKWFSELLKELGFTSVETTQHSYDSGKDISAQFDGIRYIFQCKKKKNVGIKAFQEIWFAKKNTDHIAIVVTNGVISSSAKSVADTKGILYWDKEVLIKMCKKASSTTNY